MQKLISKLRNSRMMQLGGYAVADNVSIAVFGLFYTIFLANVLTKDAYGTVVLFDIVRHIGTLFISASSQAIVLHSSKVAQVGAVSLASLRIQLLYLVVFAGILSLLSGYLADLLNAPQLEKLFVWLIPILFLNIIFLIGRTIYWGQNQIKMVFVLDSVFTICFIVSAFAAYLTGNLETPLHVVWVFILSRSISGLLALPVFFQFGVFSAHASDWHMPVWRFARASFVNSLGVLSFARVDRLILSALLTPIAAATYNAAAIVFNAFMLINETMNMIVFPRAARIFESDQQIKINGLKDLYIKYALGFVLLSLPAVIVLVVFPAPFMQLLYGDKYTSAAKILPMFALWGLTLPIARTAASILNGIGRPQVNASLTWCLVALNLTLNVLLIPPFGVIGAAIATLITAIVSALGYLLVFRKLFGLRSTDIRKSVLYNS